MVLKYIHYSNLSVNLLGESIFICRQFLIDDYQDNQFTFDLFFSVIDIDILT